MYKDILIDIQSILEDTESLIASFNLENTPSIIKEQQVNEDNIVTKLNFILENFEVFKKVVKDNKPHIKIKDFGKHLLRKYKIGKDHKRHKILKNARKKAHSAIANSKRNISNKLKG